MSIATAISALQSASADIASAITAKGVTVPSGSGYEDYASLILSIPTGGGPVLPYQRIEYIQSSGTQYIDLGILPDNNTSIIVDTSWGYVANTEIIGARSNNQYYELLFAAYGAYESLYYQYGTSTPRTTRFTVRNTYRTQKNNLYINEELVITANSSTFSITIPLCLFCLNNGGTKERFAKAKVYSVKIYQGDTLVRDMYPVRNGQVGYMYDTVTENLFGNSGSGSFTLGPDL